MSAEIHAWLRPTAVSMASRRRFEPRFHYGWSPVAAASREVLPVVALLSGDSEHLHAIRTRVHELSTYQADWDSYGGLPLQWDVIEPVRNLVLQLDEYMQIAPSVSMTGEGGLILSWGGSEAELDLTVQPSRTDDPLVYYRDASGEWEMSARECRLLDKWLWTASAAS